MNRFFKKKAVKRLFCFLFVVVPFTILFNSSLTEEGKNYEAVFSDKNGAKGREDYERGADLLPLKYDMKLSYQGSELKLNAPVCSHYNRIYLPLKQITAQLNGSISSKDNTVSLKLLGEGTDMSWTNNVYKQGKIKKTLREPLVLKNGDIYISLFDFCEILNLSTEWDIQKTALGLYRNDNMPKNPSVKDNAGTNKAYLRLEDLFAGKYYDNADSLAKLRIMADYLYSTGIPFHVAWVPRYVEPENNLDNDLTKVESFYNADFIFTMDTFIKRNGLIGLHGYTHQNGKEPTYDGIEFTDKVNSSWEQAKFRIESSIKTADKLDIPIAFFETPHYAGTPMQFKILEKYFNYIYQPMPEDIQDYVVDKHLGTRVIRYIPTPLGYIKGEEDVKDMPDRIKKLDKDSLASYFYHPFLEFQFIKGEKEQIGKTVYSYSQDSYLHKLNEAFTKNGYKFDKITNLK